MTSKRTQFVTIGTSPFVDTSVAVGPFGGRLGQANALAAAEEMKQLGYVTEVCELFHVDDLEPVVNDEGADE